ncbi:hypothetical protein VCHA53O466_140143 [Vibrio chagasii]|nr:hypothetical protein VCHA53O466_140143 [Vibrio chagasii]
MRRSKLKIKNINNLGSVTLKAGQLSGFTLIETFLALSLFAGSQYLRLNSEVELVHTENLRDLGKDIGLAMTAIDKRLSIDGVSLPLGEAWDESWDGFNTVRDYMLRRELALGGQIGCENDGMGWTPKSGSTHGVNLLPCHVLQGSLPYSLDMHGKRHSAVDGEVLSSWSLVVWQVGRSHPVDFTTRLSHVIRGYESETPVLTMGTVSSSIVNVANFKQITEQSLCLSEITCGVMFTYSPSVTSDSVNRYVQVGGDDVNLSEGVRFNTRAETPVMCTNADGSETECGISLEDIGESAQAQDAAAVNAMSLGVKSVSIVDSDCGDGLPCRQTLSDVGGLNVGDFNRMVSNKELVVTSNVDTIFRVDDNVYAKQLNVDESAISHGLISIDGGGVIEGNLTRDGDGRNSATLSELFSRELSAPVYNFTDVNLAGKPCNGQREITADGGIHYTCRGNTWVAVDDIIPSGLIAGFDLRTCPDGWSYVAELSEGDVISHINGGASFEQVSTANADYAQKKMTYDHMPAHAATYNRQHRGGSGISYYSRGGAKRLSPDRYWANTSCAGYGTGNEIQSGCTSQGTLQGFNVHPDSKGVLYCEKD